MTDVGNPLELALGNPWGVLDSILDGPLHPGGRAATERLLDRAGVDSETRLLDVGCGAGEALAQARERGATAVGLDRDPGEDSRSVRGEMTQVPLQTGSVDVVLGECVLCLSASLPDALAETHRVLAEGGRLAFSDVVVETDLDGIPDGLARTLCLDGRRDQQAIVAAIENAGFTVDGIQTHRSDLLAMRDELDRKVDYEGLLRALGERGERTLEGIERLESAVENGDVGYISVVAHVPSSRSQ